MNKLTPMHLRNLPEDSPRGAETFNHPEFFDLLFSYIKPENYLELGVRNGDTFLKVAKYCKNMIGVDISTNNFELENNMTFHVMSTDSYFEKLNKDVIFDCVFIDADHSHEQSLKDFLNVKDKIIEDGFIFFHDTYPYHEKYMDPGACNDVYKTSLYIKEKLIDEFEVITLPFNPGITLVKKMSRKKQLIYK
jgi:predicted O-methyltransferase YrrM